MPSSLVLRALVAVAPFALAAPLLKAIRVVSGGESLALLRPELLAAAGAALIAAGGALLATRWPRLYLAAVQATALLGASLELVGHSFLRASGRSLDWDLLVYALVRPVETWPVVRSEVSAPLLAALGLALAAALSAPWRLRAGAAPAPRRRRRGFALLAAGAAGIAVSLVPAGAGDDPTLGRDAVVELVYTAWRDEPRGAAAAAPRPSGPARLVRTGSGALPNVAVIVLESTSAAATTVHSPDLPTTPFLARLAQRSLVAERAYAVIPHTSKSLVSILCGFEPRASVDVVEAEPGRLPGRCLAELLAEHGYATAFFQPATRRFERRPGLVRNLGFDFFQSGDEMDARGFERANYFGYEDAILLEPSRRWLAANGDRPFLVTYMTNAPHHEYLPLRRYGRRKLDPDRRRNRYLNSVRYLDFLLRDLFEQYQSLGLYENTVFVIVGDHGEGFGEHGLRLHDDVMYDEGLRVPFVVHDARPNGRTGLVPGPASLLDVAPTVLALAGFRGEGGALAGHSLLEPLPPRFVPAACYRRFQCLAGVRGGEKFIYYYGTRPPELFDLARDPGERSNLAPERPEAVARWQADLLAWRDGVRALYEPLDAGVAVAQQAAAPEHAVSARFGELVELLGYDGPKHGRDRVRLTLHFRALGRVPPGYELVLRGHEEGRVHEFPYVPGGGTEPIQRWEPGRRLADPHVIRLPHRLRTRPFDLCLALVHAEAGPVLAQGARVDARQCVWIAHVDPPPRPEQAAAR